jgi:hypothetical protein
MLYQLSYSRLTVGDKTMVDRGGFEPPKAKPLDLQSSPVDRFGTCPDSHADTFVPAGPVRRQALIHNVKGTVWSWRRDLNPQPAHYK